MTLKLVVFDFDGVIIDSEPLMRQAFAYSYAAIGRTDEPPVEAYLSHMGKPFSNIMDALNLPHEMWPHYSSYAGRHSYLVVLFNGMVAALEHFRSKGLTLALLTGKDRPRTLALLSQLGLDRCFSMVVTSDDVVRPKPHADGLVGILDALAVAPDQAVMIGDSVHDLACAQAAGVKGIGVLWGTRPDLLREVCRPDDLVADVPSLINLIDGLR